MADDQFEEGPDTGEVEERPEPKWEDVLRIEGLMMQGFLAALGMDDTYWEKLKTLRSYAEAKNPNMRITYSRVLKAMILSIYEVKLAKDKEGTGG